MWINKIANYTPFFDQQSMFTQAINIYSEYGQKKQQLWQLSPIRLINNYKYFPITFSKQGDRTQPILEHTADSASVVRCANNSLYSNLAFVYARDRKTSKIDGSRTNPNNRQNIRNQPERK